MKPVPAGAAAAVPLAVCVSLSAALVALSSPVSASPVSAAPGRATRAEPDPVPRPLVVAFCAALAEDGRAAEVREVASSLRDAGGPCRVCVRFYRTLSSVCAPKRRTSPAAGRGGAVDPSTGLLDTASRLGRLLGPDPLLAGGGERRRIVSELVPALRGIGAPRSAGRSYFTTLAAYVRAPSRRDSPPPDGVGAGGDAAGSPDRGAAVEEIFG